MGEVSVAEEFVPDSLMAETAHPLAHLRVPAQQPQTLRCWGLARSGVMPSSSPRLQRGSGILLVVIAAMVVLGLHLPT